MGSSGAGRMTSPLLAQYSGAKSFIEMFSRGLKSELAAYNIHVQVQAPLFVATKLAKIRKTSLTVPSPAAYARAAVEHQAAPRVACHHDWPQDAPADQEGRDEEGGSARRAGEEGQVRAYRQCGQVSRTRVCALVSECGVTQFSHCGTISSAFHSHARQASVRAAGAHPLYSHAQM